MSRCEIAAMWFNAARMKTKEEGGWGGWRDTLSRRAP